MHVRCWGMDAQVLWFPTKVIKSELTASKVDGECTLPVSITLGKLMPLVNKIGADQKTLYRNIILCQSAEN